MTTNGQKPAKKPRPQSELELATMRHARNLIMRLQSPAARQRVVQYLAGACMQEEPARGYEEPAEVEDPRQTKLSDAYPPAPAEDVFE